MASSRSLALWVVITLVLPPQLNCAKSSLWPSSAHDDGSCLSWRVMVEANNARGWRTVPAPCVGYVRSYMTRGQYGRDLDSVMEQVSAYVDQIAAADDGLDAWIFDIDDTCLSNLLYYEAKRFGTQAHAHRNRETLGDLRLRGDQRRPGDQRRRIGGGGGGKAARARLRIRRRRTARRRRTTQAHPCLGERAAARCCSGGGRGQRRLHGARTHQRDGNGDRKGKLFMTLQEKGFKLFLLSGRDEETLGSCTSQNLESEGFSGYERLLMRTPDYRGQSSSLFKSAIRKQLVDEGYRIRGNVGDQWSDLQGDNVGDRVFKIPNPMYFVP